MVTFNKDKDKDTNKLDISDYIYAIVAGMIVYIFFVLGFSL